MLYRFAVILSGIALAACGGGGGGDSSNPNPTPTQNRAPIAQAGPDQSVVLGVVTLNASASTDPDGDLLSYAWTMTSRPNGSSASLAQANSAMPTFTADLAGAYQLSLVVNDGKLSSAASSVTVTASAQNAAPIAQAGVDQSAIVGSLVTLNGSTSSDANGDPLTYAWTLTTRPAGSAALLSAPTSAMPSFTADVAGTYVASLVVNDGKVNSAPATVTITAAVGNAAPVANAGVAQSVTTGTLVTLDGSKSSDANGDALTYAWTLTSRPAGSAALLTTPTSAMPRFTADVSGTYVASLVVNDGKLNSAPATVTTTAAVGNVAPVAHAGTAQNVTTGALVTLDGSKSSDANGDPLTYAWTLTSRPSTSTSSLNNPTSPLPTLTADVAGTYVASLVVNDGKANSLPASVTITAVVANVAPVADAGAAQNVSTGNVVTLNASASSDANGDALTYAWSLTGKPGGSTAALSDRSAVKPTFTADRAGTYVLTLQVSDGKANSAPATVTITASTANSVPVANAGPAQIVTTGAVVTLNGSASSDADGDALTYSWTLTGKPSGSTAVLSGATSATPTFTADKQGSYVASLQVNDGKVTSAVATVAISTEVKPPYGNVDTSVTSYTSLSFRILPFTASKVFYLLQDASLPAPTVATLIATGTATPFLGELSATYPVVSMTPGLLTKIYLVSQDANGNTSTVFTFLAATTPLSLPLGTVVYQGLTYLAPAAPHAPTYDQAAAHCADTINGSTGWRLPTKAEVSAVFHTFQVGNLVANQNWLTRSFWTSTPGSLPGTHIFWEAITGLERSDSSTGAGVYTVCVR